MPFLPSPDRPSANDGEKPSANDDITPRLRIDGMVVDQVTIALRTYLKEMAKDMQSSQCEMEQRLLAAIDESGRRHSRSSSKNTSDVKAKEVVRQVAPSTDKLDSEYSSEGSEKLGKRGQRKQENGKVRTAKAFEMMQQLSPEHSPARSYEEEARKASKPTYESKDAEDGDVKAMAPALQKGGHQKTWQTVLWKVLSQPESSKAAKAYDIFVPIFVLVTAAISLSQTLSDPVLPHNIARLLNFIVDALFFAEIGLYWIVAPDRIAFLFKLINLVDIAVSTLPLLIRMVALFMQAEEVPRNVVFLGCITVLRLLKIARRLQKMLLIEEAFWQILESLPVLMYILMIIIMTSAVAVYIVEDRETFPSLRGAIWFTSITMSTVGYGDMYPVTPHGQGIVGLLAIMSLLYMAMPIGIIGHVFTDVWQRRDRILVCRKMQAILLHWGYTAQDIPTLFNIFDSKNTGELDFADFRRMMHQMQLGLTNERISELFQSIDRTGEGYIEEPDLVRVLFPGNYHGIYGFEDESDRFCDCGTMLVPYAASCRVCGAQVSRSPSRRSNTGGSGLGDASRSPSRIINNAGLGDDS